jgi:hypothetical protein
MPPYGPQQPQRIDYLAVRARVIHRLMPIVEPWLKADVLATGGR